MMMIMRSAALVACLSVESAAFLAPVAPAAVARDVQLGAAKAPFAVPLWGRDDFEEADETSRCSASRKNRTLCANRRENDRAPAFPLPRAGGTVKCTVYDIGGGLTSVLSATCSKQLPMIPHVGVRVFGTEWFYSDVIESRPAPVMREMLESFPQVTFDLGAPTCTEEELEAWIESDDLQRDWQPESYNVFDHNCNHFGKAIADRITEKGLDDDLMRPVIDVTEKMLSELPEWRRNLGLSLMNQVTRLVVVSWGRATRKKKKELAEKAAAEAA